MKSFLLSGSLGAALWIFCQTVYASPTKSLSTKCPAVIANQSSGSIIFDKTSDKKNIKCFASSKNARKAGFLPNVELKDLDFSGWWRLKFTKIKDTCGKYPSKTDLVLFVQILQEGNAVFTDFCPSTGRQVGVKTTSGVSVSRTESVGGGLNSLSCASAIVELTEHLEIEKIVDRAPAYSAQLTRVYRCPGIEEGSTTCSTVFEGRALPETHKIWPAVESNTSKLDLSCNKALGKCSQCHENLTDPATTR